MPPYSPVMAGVGSAIVIDKLRLVPEYLSTISEVIRMVFCFPDLCAAETPGLLAADGLPDFAAPRFYIVPLPEGVIELGQAAAGGRALLHFKKLLKR